MTENTIITSSATAMIGILLLVVVFAVYFGLKSRRSNEPVFSAPGTEVVKRSFHPTAPSEYGKKNQPSFVSPSDTLERITFKRFDDVLGEIEVDGTPYKTFDAGELVVNHPKKKLSIIFKVDGYGNDQRTINHVKISEDPAKGGTVFHVKHNQQDAVALQHWLDQHAYGGLFSDEVMMFRDLMVEIAQFNQLLASKKVRWNRGGYKSSI